MTASWTPSPEVVRVAVVGVGAMGANHARVYSSLKGAELVAVVDAQEDRGRHVASLYGSRWLPSVDAIVDDIDAVSVATPSITHSDIGSKLLGHGIACLIEKPLATTEDGAQALMAASSDTGAPILVGHIERFNPAVAQLASIVADGDHILAVEAQRMSALSGRVKDVDVVSDLMVHDLDIVLDLVDSEVVDINARAVFRGSRPGDDFVTAMLTFRNGVLAVLTASRVTQNRIRRLQVTTEQRLFRVDYPSQELLIFRQGRIGGIDDDPGEGNRYVLDVGTERVFVGQVEPLHAELSHFLAVCRGEEAPRVSAQQALAALRTVWVIRDEIAGQRHAD